MLEERIAELREDSMRQKSFQSSTPVSMRTNDKVRDSGVGETRFSGEFKQMKEKSPSPDNAPPKDHNISAERLTGKTLMDVYRDAGARPRVYSDRESTPNIDRRQETEAAHPNRYRTSHTPREDYQDFDDDYLPSGVTRRRSRVRFRSPYDDDAFEYPKSRQTIKPATYDGSGPWLDYHAHFEACAELSAWNYNQKGLYLAVSLRGSAQGVLGNMPKGAKPDYHSLIKALEDRFAPPSQTELYRVQMRERRQRAGESLPELGQAIRRLANLAYPTATAEIRETLSKDQFVDALVDSEMRIRIKQARPKNLNDAIQLAVELEAYNRAEKRNYARPTTTEPVDGKTASALEDLCAKLESLQNEMRELKAQRKESSPQARQKESNQTSGAQKTCYFCRKPGHLRKDCRAYKAQRQARQSHQTNDFKAKPSSRRIKTGDKTPINASPVGLEAGLFIEMDVCGVKAKLLVDTGATVTLISTRLFHRIPEENQPKLSPFSRAILDAGGNCLPISGFGTFSAKICALSCKLDGVVADLSNDGIVGLDFMDENECTIDVKKKKICIKGKRYNLVKEGSFGCYRIVALNTVTIPTNQEVVIKGKVCVPEGESISLVQGLVEPNEKFVSAGTLVGRTLVKADTVVPIRVLNLGSENRTIYSGTHIAEMSSVCEVHTERRTKRNSKLHEKLEDLLERSSTDLSEDQKSKVRNFLQQYSHAFALSNSELGATNVVEHEIDVGNAHPIKEPLRRVPYHAAEEIDKHVNDMLDGGVIERSSSPWAAGVVLVRKKDGSTRFCVDYRKLNGLTIKDAYPLPRIDDSLDSLSGSAWFSTLDLCSGYWQVSVKEEDRPKTAFVTRKGLFQFRKMPFGLSCAPATFQRLMETVMAGLQWEICLIYLDDVIVVGKTFEDMIVNLSKVFDRIVEAGLKLKPKKCALFSRRVLYLGHVITEDGISTDPEKVEAIRNWPEPCNVSELRSFLGICGYYRRFIEKFAEKAKPLTRLTEKGNALVWTPECQDAFNGLKGVIPSSQSSQNYA